jgi:hypothetical protein
MDCRTCEPTLIDLVHSELATDAAREAHAHLATCASCRRSFETLIAATRMAAQMPLVEPPPHVAGRVMELAEAHAREAIARQRLAAPRPTPWQALLDFVGRLATRPQVAMATVMVLIVAVGLWSLPRLQRAPSATSGVVVNPEPPEGEAAPAGVEPAEPLDLKVDMRAGRIRSKDGVPLAQPAAAPALPATEPAAEQLAKGNRAAEDPFDTLDDVDLGEVAARQNLADRDKKERAREGKAKADLSEREFAAAPPARRADKVADELAQLGAESGPGGLGRSGQGTGTRARSASTSTSAPAPASATAPAKAAKPKPAAEPTAVAEGSAVGGAAPADMAASSLATRLAAARALARENGCAKALPSYQRIVSAAPSSPEAGNALLEMAQCRRNAGDLDAARSLLKKATDVPAVSSRARAQLEALEDAPPRPASSTPASN